MERIVCIYQQMRIPALNVASRFPPSKRARVIRDEHMQYGETSLLTIVLEDGLEMHTQAFHSRKR